MICPSNVNKATKSMLLSEVNAEIRACENDPKFCDKQLASRAKILSKFDRMIDNLDD